MEHPSERCWGSFGGSFPPPRHVLQDPSPASTNKTPECFFPAGNRAQTLHPSLGSSRSQQTNLAVPLCSSCCPCEERAVPVVGGRGMLAADFGRLPAARRRADAAGGAFLHPPRPGLLCFALGLSPATRRSRLNTRDPSATRLRSRAIGAIYLANFSKMCY